MDTLREKHLALGARFAEFQSVEAPAVYGLGAAAEYAAARNAVALMDRSALGRIELSGADRNDFLQRMTSNDMRPVKDGHGNQTVLTTPEAHIVELLTVYPRAESLLCITSPQNTEKVLTWFRRNIFFRDKVKPRDTSSDTSQLTLFGPHAAKLLLASGSAGAAQLADFDCVTTTIFGIEALVARLPESGGAYDIICPANSVEALWDSLLLAGESFGIAPMGTVAYDMLRIEAAHPLYGAELSEDGNPLEAGLNHAISFAKGCYTGQEVIARLDTYQRLKQRLARFELSTLPHVMTPIGLLADKAEVGQLTSVAALPDGRVVALGYVRVKAFAEGTAYTLAADTGVQAILQSAVTTIGKVVA